MRLWGLPVNATVKNSFKVLNLSILRLCEDYQTLFV